MLAITPAHTQALMSLLSTVANVATRRTESQHRLAETAVRLEHERDLFASKADLVRGLVSALGEKRVAAVKDGFSEVLRLYVEGAHHYMEQQRRLSGELMEIEDVLRRAECMKQINDADLGLRQIRRDARRLYNRMTEVMLQLGGAALEIGADSRLRLGFNG